MTARLSLADYHYSCPTTCKRMSSQSAEGGHDGWIDLLQLVQVSCCTVMCSLLLQYIVCNDYQCVKKAAVFHTVHAPIIASLELQLTTACESSLWSANAELLSAEAVLSTFLRSSWAMHSAIFVVMMFP